MNQAKKVTIPLSMTREDWVELVHAAGSKWEMVEHMPDADEPWLKKWARDLKRLYNHVQKRVEAEGIEC
jgi:hypothetical protein